LGERVGSNVGVDLNDTTKGFFNQIKPIALSISVDNLAEVVFLSFCALIWEIG